MDKEASSPFLEKKGLDGVIFIPNTPFSTHEHKRGSNLFLYIAAAIACLTTFSCGAAFSWTSPVIPKLNGLIEPENNPLPAPITPSEETLLAALICIGACVGPLIAGKLSDWIGRKKTIILIAFPVLSHYLIVGFSSNITIFMIGRFLAGISAGSAFTVLPIYLGEIAEDHNRGAVGCLLGVQAACGICSSFIIGPYLSVKMFSLVSIIPIIIFLITFTLFIPESPLYLASIGDIEGVKNSLRKFRNKSEDEILRESMEINKSLQEANCSKSGVLDLFINPASRRGLIVSVGLVILQQFSGINPLTAYLQTIFDAAGSNIPSHISAMIIGVMQIFANILTSAVVEKYGRRPLVLASTMGCFLSVIVLGVFFYLKSHQYNVDSFFWLPIASMICYIITFNLGLGPLPWAIVGEIFPANVKSVASTLTTSFAFIASFTMTMVFPLVNMHLGMAQSFLVLGGCCLVGIIFVYFNVPETKGKSLTEIQDILSRSKK